jgi:hypothetical protein
LCPKVTELFAQIRRRGALVERSNGTPFRSAAFDEEVVDIDPGKVEDDLNGLFLVRQVMPFGLLEAYRELIQLDLRARQLVIVDIDEFRRMLFSPGVNLRRVELIQLSGSESFVGRGMAAFAHSASISALTSENLASQTTADASLLPQSSTGQSSSRL